MIASVDEWRAQDLFAMWMKVVQLALEDGYVDASEQQRMRYELMIRRWVSKDYCKVRIQARIQV